MLLGWPAHAVGGNDAPPRQSSDDTNCQWCNAHDAVLVTNDHGKKDPKIFDLLNQHYVHAVFVPESILSKPRHIVARTLLKAAEAIHDEAEKGLLKHGLRPGGGLSKLTKKKAK